MAIAHVQTPAGGAANSSATSINVSVPSVAAGSLLVVGWRYSTGGRTVTVSDDKGGTWANAVEAIDTGDSNSTTGISYAMNAAGGTTVVTFGISGGALNLRMIASEFSGVATASALDKTAMAIGSNTAPASGSVTPTTDGQLLYACTHISSNDTFTAGTDFTINTTVIVTAGSQRLATERFIQTTAAAHNGNFTTGAVVSWGCVLATFKAPASVTLTPGVGSVPQTGYAPSLGFAINLPDVP